MCTEPIAKSLKTQLAQTYQVFFVFAVSSYSEYAHCLDVKDRQVAETGLLMNKPDYLKMVETMTPHIPEGRPRLFFIKQHLTTKNQLFSASHSLAGDSDPKKKTSAPVKKLAELTRADSSKVVYVEGSQHKIQYEVRILIP